MRVPSRRGLVVLAVVHLLAVLSGLATGVLFGRDLPSIGTLDLQRLPQMTVLLDRHGERLSTFAEQRRTPVTLDRISPLFLKALLATEDPRFYRHIGVDLQAVARAALATLTTFRFGQGGSTITQQLARDAFLYPSKTVTRKLKEALLALTIEKNYTKREILELYCNRIYLGHGRYGIEAAAQYYFGKSSKDLTLPEAALLAGLPQRPEGYSPIREPQKAVSRRNHVLARMIEEGAIDAPTARKAMQAKLVIAKSATSRPKAPYFSEEVRRFLLKQFGEDALYRSGLIAHTTLDPQLQEAAERGVRAGLDEYGRRHQLVPAGRALPEGATRDDYVDPEWDEPHRAGDILDAVALSVAIDRAVVRVGPTEFTLGADEVKWTGRRVFTGLFQPGKLYPVKVLEVETDGRPRAIELAADPPVQAAFLALDTQTGDVLALVGGKDFDRSEFDRATQAARQAGSAIKPFIYAAAVEHGMSPGQLIWDVPTVWTMPGSPTPYQPENYDVKYEGLITLQHALDHSRNIPTIRLLDALGYQPAIEMAERLGIRSSLKPYPSLALGAFEVRLVELVAAYGAFAHGGVLVTPNMVRSVTDPQGQELWSSKPETREVLRPEISAAMTSLLSGPTTRGTAADALRLGRPTIGKTGTTDDYTDAWFIGCTPSIAAGAWIGFDQRQTLGRGETGGRTALPMWMKFMEEGLRGRPAEPFPVPAGMEYATLDLATGYRATPEAGCQKTFSAPDYDTRASARPCTVRDHQRAALPYPLQRYPLRGDGGLLIPVADAARLVSMAPDRFQMVGSGKALHYDWGANQGSVLLAWTDADWSGYLAALAHGAPAPDEVPWRGKDGWPAEVVGVNTSGTVRPPETPADPQ